MLHVGIVGLPNVGKSTLFNALTNRQVPAENFPFCTVEPNSAIISIPDNFLERLARATNNPKLMPAMVEFWDIAGLVRGAHKGVGLGNQFLHYIRSVDAIVIVLRAFTKSDVVLVEEEISPLRDLEIIESELVLADIALADKHRIAAKSRARNINSKEAIFEYSVLEKVWRAMRDNIKNARQIELSEDERAVIKQYEFLSMKPVVILVNTDEAEDGDHSQWSEKLGRPAIALSVSSQAECAEIKDISERLVWRETLGLRASLEDLIDACYRALGSVIFYTFGNGIARAWSVTAGTTASQAAGLIHSDFEDSFIKAQIFKFEDLEKYGERGCRDKGLVQVVGKQYEVKNQEIYWFVVKE